MRIMLTILVAKVVRLQKHLETRIQVKIILIIITNVIKTRKSKVIVMEIVMVTVRAIVK